MKKTALLMCLVLSTSLFIIGSIISFSDGDDEHIDVIDKNTEIAI